MKSRAAPSFWKFYRQLPRQIRQQAVQAYQLWRANPDLPGLRFKLVNSAQAIYSVRVTESYRALGRLEGDTIAWFFIGSHDDYSRRLG